MDCDGTIAARGGMWSGALAAVANRALPGRVKGEVHQPIASKIRKALKDQSVHELLERVMVLESPCRGERGDE